MPSHMLRPNREKPETLYIQGFHAAIKVKWFHLHRLQMTILDDSWLSLAATYRFTLLSSKKGFEVEATPKNIDIIVSSKSKNTRK